MKTPVLKNKKFYHQLLPHWVLFFLLLITNCFSVFSQCPANIDFESGTFDGWTCLVGSVADVNDLNVITLNPVQGPVPGRHTMLSSYPGDGLDEYGGFPKNCPNGSGHSIRLGNNLAGGGAEGLFYQFVIPPNSNKFTLTYNYAVVFEDPGHAAEKQPRLEIEIIDITDEVPLDCFSFTYIADNSLPGFQTSPLHPHDSPVRYKDWTANTIYLNGYQGKTIGLSIKTADCTYSVHFGYAYLDVSSKCDNSLVGETFCPQDTAIDVTAPSGYQSYNWYNSSLTQLLGTGQMLHLQPPPVAGTNLAVALTPYPGYGCIDTLIIGLQDTLNVTANAGPDVTLCNSSPVQIGVSPIGGMRYRWSPDYKLSDPNIANPIATPETDTTYTLTMQSVGGGCLSTDMVKVFVKNIDNTLQLIGDSIHCIGQGSDPVLKVLSANNVQWYKNDLLIPGATQLSYPVTSTGIYYAALINNICTTPVKTRSIDIVIDTALSGITYPMVDVAFNFPLQLHARGNDFAVSVLWSPGLNLDDRNSFAPYFRGLNQQLYTIEIKNPQGCTTVDTQLVKTHKEIAIYVPTIFSPGADGKNDYLRPLLLGFEKVKYFRIFNRWGKLIFESKSDFPGWDGRIGKLPQETQTVVWMLEAVDIDGKTHFRKGTSLLIN